MDIFRETTKGNLWHLVILICLCSTVVDGKLDGKVLQSNETLGNLNVVQKWKRMEQNLKESIINVYIKLQSYFPIYLSEHMLNSYEEEGCAIDLLRWSEGIKDLKPWAFQLVDASSTSLDGVLNGNLGFFGHYQQCLDVVVGNETGEMHSYSEVSRGKYCLVDIKPPMPTKPRFFKLSETVHGLEAVASRDTVIGEIAKSAFLFYLTPIRWALCLPSSCSDQNINHAVSSIGLLFNMDVRISRCEVKQPYTALTKEEMVAICTFGVLIFLAFAGTVTDLWCAKLETPLERTSLKILVGFSVPRNFKKIFNTVTPSPAMSCFYGIKFLSISWIILGHTYLNLNHAIVRDIKYGETFIKDFFLQVISNTAVAVDTFFVISSVLLSKHFVENLLIKKRKFNFPIYFIHRYWRFTPNQLALMAFTFLPYLSPGPLGPDIIRKNRTNCSNYWWRNLLYIQNWFDGNALCHQLLWYLAADFQLYLFSLVILLPLVRRPAAGLVINFLCAAVSILASGIVIYVMDFPPTMLMSNPDRQQLYQFATYHYHLPYTHMPSYAVGIFVGYLVATRQKIVIKPIIQVLGWTTSVVMALATVYGTYEWNSGRDATVAERLFYSSLHRPAWSVAVGWLIFTCITGHGGAVNRILSWKGWIPFGRLTFMAYLVNMLVQDHFIGRTNPITSSHYLGVHIFFANLIITFGLSLIASLLVESPCLALEKIALAPFMKKTEQTSQKSTTILS